MIEYRWSALNITPDESMMENAIAKFEIDLPYISVPEFVFKNITRFFEVNFRVTST